jgi:hypothetical protein
MEAENTILHAENGRKLRPLDVADPEDYKLIFLTPEMEVREVPESDATACLSWCFWAVLMAAPFVCLYLLGLIVGSGN